MTQWLDEIQLVTFDGPGVLFDWHSGLARVGVTDPGEMAKVGVRMGELAIVEPFRRWSELVRQALAETRPDLRPAAIGMFAADLGRLPTWPDALPTLSTLRDVVQIGLIANSDAQHQLDTAQSCKTRWDVCVNSEELRAHLQTERAWDATVRAGVTRAAVTRDAWLHVSASERTLDLAKARGLRTCLLQRDEVQGQTPRDLNLRDLHELTRLLLEAKQGPLLVEIRVEAPEPLRPQLGQWLRETLLPAMRRVPGVRAARLFVREDGSLLEHYAFGSRREVSEWQNTFAAEQRAMVRDAFGHEVVRHVHVATLQGAF
jgi:FMN phosphatase YigB (HAD superfamily)